MSNLVLYSIPAFLLLIAVELLWTRRHPEARGYERKDTAASLAMGLGNVAISALAALPRIPVFAWLYQHRLADLGASPWSWGVLLFAEDLCYYWFHRLHHEVRILWAAHVSHHSSRYYNLSTALRQPWLTPFTGPLFWAPLPLLGFSPAMVLTAQAWSLLYQFWIHTEAVGTLGPLEWALNTPSHHRVHHGKDPQYLDKNHGGIFIIWDRLFGTFALERERVTFGLTTDIHTFHPVKIAAHELVAIGADVAAATSVSRALSAVFGRPGSYQK
jgi:sterol desaturase/sphingolipid hydroxylase (fatty acid hydroxylase superfamily)